MSVTNTKKRVKTIPLVNYLKEILLSNRVFPFVLTFLVLGLLFVLFRMKGVEMDYKITALNKDIDKVRMENKDLKARKARMLSVARLRKMAQKFELKQPKQDQIIVLTK